MKPYEIFTENFSVVIHQWSIERAIEEFRKDHKSEIIAIVVTSHPIYKEFIR